MSGLPWFAILRLQIPNQTTSEKAVRLLISIILGLDALRQSLTGYSGGVYFTSLHI